VLYLLFTLMIFFMGFMILKDKTSLNWMRDLSYINIIYPILIKLFNFWSKNSFIFFLLNWIVLVLIVAFSAYYLNWFILNFDDISNIYVNTKK
jgi:hypothetical protein